MKKILIFMIGLTGLTCRADYYSIDFSNYKTGNVVELTGPEIIPLNTGTKDLVCAIPVCHNIGRSFHASHGGLSIMTPAAQDQGSITFDINPELAVIAKSVNIIGYRFHRFEETGNDHESEVEVSINNGSYHTGKLGNDRTGNAFFSITAPAEPITSVSLRLPASPFAQGDASYEITLEQITIAYDAKDNNGSRAVTQWAFAKNTDTGYYDSKEPYTMPELLVAPAMARYTAAYSSSNPDVAEFIDGKLKLKEKGKTIITAAIGANMVFNPKSIDPASYELTVDSTGNVPGSIESAAMDSNESYELFNIAGNRITGDPAPGVYIRRTATGIVSKILISR